MVFVMKKIILLLLFVTQISIVSADAIDLPNTNRHSPSTFVRLHTTDNPIYYQYINGRYAYKTYVPASFSIAMQAGNNDGASFSTPDKASTLLVWGGHNTLHEDLKSNYEKAISSIGIDYINYQVSGDDWYVLSWVKDKTVYYEKFFISDQYYNGFTLSYPRDLSNQFSHIVTDIEQSFVPGWKSGYKLYG